MTRGDPLERVTIHLALAVALEDVVAGGPPRVTPRVAVANADVEFVRTPAGYHVLVDRPSLPETLEVVVDADAYLREERTVDRSSHDPASALAVDLLPAPAYPFGGGATLVRGTVADGDGPVAGAAVSYRQGTDVGRSDDAGEFVLPVTDVGRGDVGTDDEGRRVVEPGGGSPTVEATHPDDGRTATADVTLPVGGTGRAELEF